MSYAITVLQNYIEKVQDELKKVNKSLEGLEFEMVSEDEFLKTDKQNLEKQLFDLQEALRKIF